MSLWLTTELRKYAFSDQEDCCVLKNPYLDASCQHNHPRWAYFYPSKRHTTPQVALKWVLWGMSDHRRPSAGSFSTSSATLRTTSRFMLSFCVYSAAVWFRGLHRYSRVSRLVWLGRADGNRWRLLDNEHRLHERRVSCSAADVLMEAAACWRQRKKWSAAS